ncbi:hypothetical protein [Mycobacterium sp. 141]|uniref:hypothetical protein n=1 Tax=Mycobacterium sp. 141 TaxID=1120797 RepID=UPI0012DD2190|nr:hypothetical protein [Mycobacterium sp. 141]
MSSQLSSTRWVGEDADRHRSQWQGEAAPSIRAAVGALRGASERLQRNANEQEQASSADTGITAGGLGGGQDAKPSGNTVTDTLGTLLSLGGIVNDIANAGEGIPNIGPKGLTGVTGSVLAGAGVVTSLTTMVEGITSGDDVETGNGVIGLVGSALGAANPAAGLAAGAAQLYGDMTLPTSEEDIDGVFDMGAKHMFGKAASDLTPEQTSALSDRYDGPGGVANMISDSMDYKAAEAVKFVKGLFGG